MKKRFLKIFFVNTTLAISGHAFAQSFDNSSIRICMIEAVEENVIQAIKCFEDLDPSLNILRRQIKGKPIFIILRNFCNFDWAEKRITGTERNQCIKKLASFE